MAAADRRRLRARAHRRLVPDARSSSCASACARRSPRPSRVPPETIASPARRREGCSIVCAGLGPGAGRRGRHHRHRALRPARAACGVGGARAGRAASRPCSRRGARRRFGAAGRPGDPPDRRLPRRLDDRAGAPARRACAELGVPLLLDGAQIVGRDPGRGRGDGLRLLRLLGPEVAARTGRDRAAFYVAPEWIERLRVRVSLVLRPAGLRRRPAPSSPKPGAARFDSGWLVPRHARGLARLARLPRRGRSERFDRALRAERARDLIADRVELVTAEGQAHAR